MCCCRCWWRVRSLTRTTVLLLKRSILTEKVARRGFHLSREYSIDPLEILFVREVMRTNVVSPSAGFDLGRIAGSVNRPRTAPVSGRPTPRGGLPE